MNDTAPDAAYSVTAAELRQFIEQYEHLESEKKDIAEQQKEVMAEAKGRGYDTKVIRKLIALRKRDKDDIAEEEAVLEMYKAAARHGVDPARSGAEKRHPRQARDFGAIGDIAAGDGGDVIRTPPRQGHVDLQGIGAGVGLECGADAVAPVSRHQRAGDQRPGQTGIAAFGQKRRQKIVVTF